MTINIKNRPVVLAQDNLKSETHLKLIMNKGKYD